ncbi:AT-hook motif nuclear-localized protein 26 [Cajanus cajan]|uniref:DNA-binding protein ESCAROLA n=1 Tax=Cajanus cajan TaxID=3821 RepID=A0A151R3S4_CAJCA|nr:AT-hook motif nuclear-localized protein 26 [Cajanus cajan]KYP37258.1 Putative DNA-binding protein ESCAROLA [Cajanus cajan]
MRAHKMEVADACDMFARKRQRGVCILSSIRTVTNINLRQWTSPGFVVTLHKRFGTLSFSGSLLLPLVASDLTIYLANGQGQVVGGSVVGILVASGLVVIMVLLLLCSSLVAWNWCCWWWWCKCRSLVRKGGGRERVGN